MQHRSLDRAFVFSASSNPFTSSCQLAQMEPKTFHLFPRLPKELRDAIWAFAIRPRGRVHTSSPYLTAPSTPNGRCCPVIRSGTRVRPGVVWRRLEVATFWIRSIPGRSTRSFHDPKGIGRRTCSTAGCGQPAVNREQRSSDDSRRRNGMVRD